MDAKVEKNDDASRNRRGALKEFNKINQTIITRPETVNKYKF